MSFPPRLLVVLLLAMAMVMTIAMAIASPARADAAFGVGIGDQKLGMWQDPRLDALGIKQVRLIVAWNLVLEGDFSRYDAWMAAARARGADVLVAVNHSTTSHTALPTLGQYRQVISALRARYPHIGTFSTWNEANHRTQPTHRNPRRAAEYYNVLRAECGGCRIVAADVLDSSDMETWIKAFRRHAKSPKLWGLHNYVDTNRFRPLKKSGTARFLKLVPGEVWLTEAGGIVRFEPAYPGGGAGEARAARATERTFALARMSSRIKRVYLYHWDAETVFKGWDSGLVDHTGRARPALEVLRTEVNRQRRLRRLPLVGALPVRPSELLPLFP